jgi:choline O-acetyltransferase
VATYESASTRRFLLGRVDCIRSAHNEALQWVMAMCQDESGNEESEANDIQSGKRVTFSLYDVSKCHHFLLKLQVITV